MRHNPNEDILDELPEEFQEEAPSKLKEASIDMAYDLRDFLFAPFLSGLFVSIVILVALHVIPNFFFDIGDFIWFFGFFAPFLSGFLGDWLRGHQIHDFRLRLFLMPIMTLIVGAIPLVGVQMLGVPTIAAFILLAPHLTFVGAIAGAFCANLLRNFREMRNLTPAPAGEEAQTNG